MECPDLQEDVREGKCQLDNFNQICDGEGKYYLSYTAILPKEAVQVGLSVREVMRAHYNEYNDGQINEVNQYFIGSVRRHEAYKSSQGYEDIKGRFKEMGDFILTRSTMKTKIRIGRGSYIVYINTGLEMSLLPPWVVNKEQLKVHGH